jgi:small subunit ribosomal protein S9
MADSNWIWGTGRRKSAVARVRIRPGDGQMIVNKKQWGEYFPSRAQQIAARQAIVLTETESRFDIFVQVEGGGPQGQADAVRHGLSRALSKADPELEIALREAGFMSRDARVVERKKYGQRGARARFQFSKR